MHQRNEQIPIRKVLNSGAVQIFCSVLNVFFCIRRSAGILAARRGLKVQGSRRAAGKTIRP